MKINKRDNKALQNRFVSIFDDIIGDAETQFAEAIHDEIQAYLEEDDDVLDCVEAYLVDALKTFYRKKAKE